MKLANILAISVLVVFTAFIAQLIEYSWKSSQYNSSMIACHMAQISMRNHGIEAVRYCQDLAHSLGYKEPDQFFWFMRA